MQSKDVAVEAPIAGDDLTGEIAWLANELVGRIWGHFQARAAEFGLSVPEFKALLSIEADGALSMRELSARLHANPSNVTVTVARLEARGLVSRQSSEDRRVKGVHINEAGLALKRRIEARLQEDHPAVRGLSQEERTAFLNLLRRLQELASGR